MGLVFFASPVFACASSPSYPSSNFFNSTVYTYAGSHTEIDSSSCYTTLDFSNYSLSFNVNCNNIGSYAAYSSPDIFYSVYCVTTEGTYNLYNGKINTLGSHINSNDFKIDTFSTSSYMRNYVLPGAIRSIYVSGNIYCDSSNFIYTLTTVSLSGSSVPKKLADVIATYGDNAEDMRKAGIDFAISQILDLKAHGVNGIHLYSMNKPKVTTEIVNAIR